MSVRIVAIACIVWAFLASPAHSQNAEWYPKATDTCGEFVTKALNPRLVLVTPRRDPAMARFATAFEAATGNTDDNFAFGLMTLYCNSRAAMPLGAISTQEVLKLVDVEAMKAANGQAIPATDSALESWYQQTITYCQTNADCERIASSYKNHALGCQRGESQACIDRDRDLADIDAWNAKRRAPVGVAQAPATPVDMPACLQAATKRVAEYCKAENRQCPSGMARYYMLRAAQQADCGYSALDSPATPSLEPGPTPRYLQPSPIVPPRLPQTDQSCMAMCLNGKTASAFQACYVQCTR